MEVLPKEKMFEEFSPLSENDWKEKIKSELKGRAIEELNWRPEGFEISPFYRNNSESIYSDHFKTLSYLRSGLREGWQIRQTFNLANEKANELILESLNTGCSSINIESNKQNLSKNLEGVFPQMIPIYLESDSLKEYIDWAKALNINTEKLQGGISNCPLQDFIANQTTDLNWVNEFKSQSKLFKANPQFKLIKVNGSLFESAGASIVQQLTYSLALGNEYLEHLSDDFSIDDLSARIFFEMSIGNSYFLEIAKFRALRILWAKVIQAYHPNHSCSLHTYVIGQTSELLLGRNDIETNLIRNSQAAMAGAIGSCNEIEVLTHDGKKEKNSLRLARNIQNLLKEESYLNKVKDISMGSHYVDNLTFELVNVVWDQFMKLQVSGGCFENLNNGFIQDEISKSAQKKIDQLNDHSQTMIGENKYLKNEQSKVTWSLKRGSFQFPKIECHG